MTMLPGTSWQADAFDPMHWLAWVYAL